MFPGAWYRKKSSPFTQFFPLTVQILRDLYLAPLPSSVDPFDRAFVEQTGDYEWSRSISISPAETVAALRKALVELMLASGSLSPEHLEVTGLPASLRCRRHLEDLLSIWRSLNGALPDELAVMRHVLASSASEAVEDIEFYYDPERVELSAAERKVLEVLHGRHPSPPDMRERLLREREQYASCNAPEGTLLGEIQRGLTGDNTSLLPSDNSVLILGVRDASYEAELAAGAVQKLLDRDQTLRPSDVGILLPESQAYAAALLEPFRLAGLPLSGLPAHRQQRDLGGELVQLYLTARRRPAPALALASLYTSPLMPWSANIGIRLAKAVVEGDFDPYTKGELDERGRRMFQLIRKGQEPDARSLSRELSQLRELMHFPAELSDHRQRMNDLIATIQALLDLPASSAEVPWSEAIRLAEPRPMESGGTQRTVGGIAVFTETELPWRPVRHLLVLGFSEGSYPLRCRTNPFFLDSEIELIRQKTGLVLKSQTAAYSEGLERFRKHLANAAASVRIFIPYRGLDGRRSAPSSTLPLISRFMTSDGSPEDVVIDLHSLAPEDWPTDIPTPANLTPAAPTALPAPELDLGCNLLEIRKDDEGRPKPQSPSRLETLVVSPLAWLLGELDAKDQIWEPETANPAILGSVAHLVFEKLFLPETDAQSEERIEESVPDLLDDAVREIAPFLLAAAWSVERETLLRQVAQAAVNWRQFLLSLGATVVDNEFWLSGTAEKLAVRGKVDSLLLLPDGNTIIVDHKKSSSNRRIRRMEAGWDIQVHLYREMARSRSAIGADEPAIKAMSGSTEIGVAYNMLNDGIVVISGIDLPRTPTAARRVDGDIAGEASARLSEERRRLIAGKLRLNSAGDEKFYTQKAFMGAYAFESSPLVNAFCIHGGPDPAQDGDGDE